MFNVFLLLLFYFLENSLYSIHARHLFKMYSTQLFDHIIIILQKCHLGYLPNFIITNNVMLNIL